MKAFQVFDHPFAPIAPYLGYMERVRDLSESYTLIAPANFMGAGVDWVPLEDVWAELPPHFRANPNGHNQFDPLRARYLATHFDHVYLDIDVELWAPLKIGPFPRFEGPGVLLGNGDADLGLACWETYLRLSPAFCRPASLMFADCPCARNLEEADKKVFVHRFAGGRYFK
jgi:hypothetical protein